MGSKINVKINKKQLDKVARKLIDKNVDKMKINYECPHCHDTFEAHSGKNTCPHCHGTVNITFTT